MYLFILLIIIIYLIFLYINHNFITRITSSINVKKKLNNYEIKILKKYLTEDEDENYNEEGDGDDLVEVYLLNTNYYHFYIIENDILISYFYISPENDNKFYIFNCYTNKNYRKKGYMKKLLKYSFEIIRSFVAPTTFDKSSGAAYEQALLGPAEFCKKNNITSIYYETTINNIASINTAKSLGFSILEKDNKNIKFIKLI
jgi:RimJ/RimL family protein N-acetyltransferase